MSTFYRTTAGIIFLLILMGFPGAVAAKGFTVGTLAYSYAVEGHANIFVQGTVGNRSAIFFDKCDDQGGTDVLLFKRYRHQVLQGPYWFGGMIYIKSGNRSGYHATLGLGYEHSTKKNIVLGAFAGGAAGGDRGTSYAVANISLGYRFN